MLGVVCCKCLELSVMTMVGVVRTSMRSSMMMTIVLDTIILSTPTTQCEHERDMFMLRWILNAFESFSMS